MAQEEGMCERCGRVRKVKHLLKSLHRGKIEFDCAAIASCKQFKKRNRKAAPLELNFR